MELTDLYDFAYENNIKVDCFDLDSTKSLVIEDQQKYFIAIDPLRLASETDEKMLLSHELSHCISGGFYNRYSPFDSRAKHEVSAYKKQIYMLIKSEDLDAAVQAGYHEIWELAEEFSVPEWFMRLAVFYYQNGYIDLRLCE